MQHPSELSPDRQVGIDEGKVGCAGRRQLCAEGRKVGKCLLLLRNWEVASTSPMLGEGPQRLGRVEGGQAHPSPLIQAREAFEGC